MVWKTAEGIEKRFMLPIETIKEDVLEDPVHFLKTFERGDMSEEDYNKMVAAIKEMKDSVVKSPLSTH